MAYILTPQQTALIVIDVQEEYFDPQSPASFPEAHEKLPTINRVIEGFAAVGAPIIYVRHAHRPSGIDSGRMGDFSDPDEEDSFIEGTPRVAFHAGLALQPGAPVVTKTRYDAFSSTELDRILRTLGAQSVVLVGYMTSFCLDSTARAAQTLDYQTVFVIDAVGGPDLERLDGTTYPSGQVLEDVAASLAAGFAEVVDADHVLGRLGASAAPVAEQEAV